MATQTAAFPPENHNQERLHVPRNLRRAYRLRAAVIRQLDAIEGVEFQELYDALGKYLQIPVDVRNQLDRWTYPDTGATV